MRHFVVGAALAGLIVMLSPRGTFGIFTGVLQDSSVSILLDRYERGEIESAREVAERVKDFEAFRQSFVAEAPRWVNAAGPASVEKRRLRAAAFALEVAWAVVEAWMTVEQRMRNWPPLRTLVEWACELVRSSPEPTEAERLWFRASFELGLRIDSVFLFGEENVPRYRQVNTDREYGRAQNHLAHGVSRFPRDQEFGLLRTERTSILLLSLAQQGACWMVRGISVTPAKYKELQAEARAIRVRRRLPNAPRHFSDADVLRRSDFLTELAAVRSRIEPLVGVEEIRAKVHFNLGVIAYCFADRAGALRHFAEIDGAATDINLRFLGRFLVGFVNGQEGHEAASEAAYRSAHALLPDAQSATVALAEILFTTGRRVEATKLAEDGIISGTRMRPGGFPIDPWEQFTIFGRVQPPDVLPSLRRAVAK